MSFKSKRMDIADFIVAQFLAVLNLCGKVTPAWRVEWLNFWESDMLEMLKFNGITMMMVQIEIMGSTALCCTHSAFIKIARLDLCCFGLLLYFAHRNKLFGELSIQTGSFSATIPSNEQVNNGVSWFNFVW